MRRNIGSPLGDVRKLSSSLGKASSSPLLSTTPGIVDVELKEAHRNKCGEFLRLELTSADLYG